MAKWYLLYARICMLLLCTLYEVSSNDPVMDTTAIHMNISVGKTIILPCMVQGLQQDSKLFVIWNSPGRRPISYKKRVLLDHRFEIIQPHPSEWNLRISPSQPGDSGEYLCQLNTDPVQQKSVHLSVQVPPRITSSKDTDIIEGRQLIIYCNVTGRPRPAITWYKDDVLLPNKEEAVHKDRVSRTDAGVYKCIASNGKDSDRAFVNVNVLYPPEVSVLHRRIGQMQRKQVALECHSTAYPQDKIVWKKGNKVISKSTWQYAVQIFDGIRANHRTLNLIIRSMDSTDFGQYVCEAENSVGKARVAMYIYELTTPSPTAETTTPTSHVTTTRPPVYSTKTTSTFGHEYVKPDSTKSSTAVMVIVSDKSLGNNKSSRIQCAISTLIIPVFTSVLILISHV